MPWLLGITAAWGWRLVVVTAAAAVAIVGLIELYVVVVPVVLALFLAAVLEPLAAGLRARRWPAALAAASVFVVTLGTLLALLLWIGAGVAEEFETLGDKLAEGAESAKAWAQGPPLNLPAERVAQFDSGLRATAQGALSRLGEGAAAGARTAGEVISGLVLMLFTLFFVLKDGARMAAWMTERLPPAYRRDVVALTTSARRVMRQYVIATGLTGLIDAVLIGLA
ncbi:MAG: AI-2E family transporter, partial [Pseudonocardiaceae bacterium]